MFTGLVQKTGEVVQLEKQGEMGRLVLRTSPWDPQVDLGESIAVQGVCLTVTAMDHDALHFDILGETFSKTNLGQKRVGARLNLERALRYGDPMGGHIVNGHVDGVGHVRTLRQVDERDWSVEVACAEALAAQLVKKGSIACDGVSLTVVDVSTDGFSVHIIPHTWTNTTFSDLAEGNPVNLEADVLAKYARAILKAEGRAESLSWEMLGQLDRRE